MFLAGVLCLGLSQACSNDAEPVPDMPDPVSQPYFPSDDPGVVWETLSPSNLGWDADAGMALDEFLEESGTKAFIILVGGRMARETYFGTFTQDSVWYWASAGKTLTAFTVGQAREDGLLQLEDQTSEYLGEGWTAGALQQENLITIGHQLRMTTGLNELFFDCVEPDCLRYLANAGTRWAYHNGPYTLLESVVSAASGETWSAYFNRKLRDPIGMDGFWRSTNGKNNVYFSTARSMARFGWLVLNKGTWGEQVILSDRAYQQAMLTPSQNLNRSYGYLWWLNGQPGYMLPGSREGFDGPLFPDAPEDMVAGLGKNDQKLYLVPSMDLVVIRMGNDAGANQAGPSSYDNTLWQHLNAYLRL